jgi:hypothetical protein
MLTALIHNINIKHYTIKRVNIILIIKRGKYSYCDKAYYGK